MLDDVSPVLHRQGLVDTGEIVAEELEQFPSTAPFASVTFSSEIIAPDLAI